MRNTDGLGLEKNEFKKFTEGEVNVEKNDIKRKIDLYQGMGGCGLGGGGWGGGDRVNCVNVFGAVGFDFNDNYQ